MRFEEILVSGMVSFQKHGINENGPCSQHFETNLSVKVRLLVGTHYNSGIDKTEERHLC